ncbi:MAG: fumarate hydratase [Spirochaetes bacterium]|nr:fumarate hydratase [Spirochaetota bacterium]
MTLAQLLDANFAAAPKGAAPQAGAARFRLVTREGIDTGQGAGGGKTTGRHAGPLRIDPSVLRQLSFEAFRDINFLFRTSHLEGWASILDDPAASDNDRIVAAALLKNAAIAAEGVLPSCQDTGTATVIGLKGEGVAVGADDEAAIVEGVHDAYARCNLRFSQVAPVSLFEDKPTGTNLPAQVDIHAAGLEGPGGREYRLLFVAKGGGSANTTAFSQENRTLLDDTAFEAYLRRRVTSLGVAGCPPYHLAVVVGGTSAEHNLEILKLATAGALDHLPDISAAAGRDVRADPGALYRDRAWEARLLAIARGTGLGAQFGGAFLALDARVIRLPRHAASLPVSVGVSCSAHRNARARIDTDGAWLEELDREPARFLPRALEVLERATGAARHVDLGVPVKQVQRRLSGLAPGTLVLLDGPMVVARDAAHARFARMLRESGTLPAYLRNHIVYYAGPAQTPPGHVIGSLGPTTAQRMDPYVRAFMKAGASLVMLAKGNRSRDVSAACREYGGFSLGTIGGAAAVIAREHVTRDEVIDFADLGMEAVRRIEVRGLPAFVVIDDRGASLYDCMGECVEG